MSIEPLPTEKEDELLQEIGYSRKQLNKDLELLKFWLRNQTHLPKNRMEEGDSFLVNFLVGCKGSLEKAKSKLDAYYTIRTFCPIFQNRLGAEWLKQVARIQYLCVLPKLLSDGTLVTIIGPRDTSVELYDALNAAKRIFLNIEYLLRRSGLVLGQQVLIDAAGFSSGYAVRTPPTMLRSIVTFVKDILPIRTKRVIIFNAPPYAETVINTIVKPLMSQKMQDRLTVTKDNMDKVFKLMDDSKFEGKTTDIAALSEKWEKALETWDRIPYLDEKVDESLRPSNDSPCNNPYFGLHGSIKALVID